jgi:CheY-like chemotaxis protein
MTDPESILVLDDDPDLVGLVRRVLEGEGWTVRSAFDAREALKLCEESMPCLLLVDLMLPHMDGEAFLSELRSRFPDTSPKVALLTASAVREEVAERAEVDASLPKPFELDDVRALVRQLCGEPPAR